MSFHVVSCHAFFYVILWHVVSCLFVSSYQVNGLFGPSFNKVGGGGERDGGGVKYVFLSPRRQLRCRAEGKTHVIRGSVAAAAAALTLTSILDVASV
jgi:hypothetical protein